METGYSTLQSEQRTENVSYQRFEPEDDRGGRDEYDDDEWLEHLYEDMEVDDLMEELDFNYDLETNYVVDRNDEHIPEETITEEESESGREKDYYDGPETDIPEDGDQ